MNIPVDPLENLEYFQFGIAVCRFMYPVDTNTVISEKTILSRRFDIAKNQNETIFDYIDDGTPEAIQYKVETIHMRVHVWKGREIAVGYSHLTNTLYVSKFFNQWSVE